MSEELKSQANVEAKPATAAAPQAQPAAKPAARPAAPAAPAKPAVNELKPKTVAPAELYAEMKRLHDQEGMDLPAQLDRCRLDGRGSRCGLSSRINCYR